MASVTNFSAGAPLQQAFRPIDPIEPIQIYSISSKRLIGQNWQIDPSATVEEQLVATKLFQIAKSVSEFFWTKLKLCGTDNLGKLPPFFIDCKPGSTSFSFGLADHLEQFNFANPDALLPEVVAHEYVHAVVHSLNPLGAIGQAGAINESLADVFAIAFKGLNTDWKIGTYRTLSLDFTTKNVIEIPEGDESQENDFGQVHNNSLVLSHGFYLTVQQHPACSNELLQIWWNSFLQLKIHTHVGFVAKTIEVAGSNFLLLEAIKKSWLTIGFKL